MRLGYIPRAKQVCSLTCETHLQSHQGSCWLQVIFYFEGSA